MAAYSEDELTRLTKEVELLKIEKLLQRDEVCALKAAVRSQQEEIDLLNRTVQEMKSQAFQDEPVRNVGREVRLRYLELHRRRIGKPIGSLGDQRIKCGNRAAHRGRPVADALLCQTRLMTDHEVYRDLYGVTPARIAENRNVPELVEVTGFRASLRSEQKLTSPFQTLFECLLEIADACSTPSELQRAFQEDRVLQKTHHSLQDCYDKIMARSPP